MTELEENIIKLVEKGYSFRKIAKILQRNYEKEILTEKKELMRQGLLTEDDIKRGKENRKRIELMNNALVQRIFKYKMQGFSDNAISKMHDINIHQTEVSRYVREGIELGLIKKDEIKKAENERKEKEKENNPDRKRVLEGLRRGEIDTIIARDTTVGYQQVKNIRLELIEEGIITQDEINEAREAAKRQQEKESNLEEKEEIHIDEEKLLSYLILGYDTEIIMKKMQILDIEQYREIVKKLIKEKRITEQEIREYRERKKREDKAKILEELKKGTSQRKIAKLMDTTLCRVQTYIKKIKEEENISDEDILNWKAEKENSFEKRKPAVLEGLRQGLSRGEIVEQYPKQELSRGDVKNIRNLLVREEIITEEEIIKYRQLRQKQKREKKNSELTKDDKQIIQYLENGYKAAEIASLEHKSRSWVSVKIANVKKKTGITDDDIKKYRIKRKEKEEREEKEKEEREKREEKEKEERKKEIKYNKLKSEIVSIVKLNKKPSELEKGKLREYIDLSYEKYKKVKISKSELLFLKQGLQKIVITYEDIVEYVRICISVEEYSEALNFIKNRHEIKGINIPKEKENAIEMAETSLIRACKVQKAIRLIKLGNTNTEVISNVSGLSKDEINILKIKLSGKPIRIFNVIRREKMIRLLVKDKELYNMKNTQISDFEMDDIEQQAKYRKIPPSKRDREAQVKQDSIIRIIVLLKKLGKKTESIAKTLEMEPEEVEEKIKIALSVGLIKPTELQGIQLMNYQALNPEQIQI